MTSKPCFKQSVKLSSLGVALPLTLAYNMSEKQVSVRLTEQEMMWLKLLSFWQTEQAIASIIQSNRQHFWSRLVWLFLPLEWEMYISKSLRQLHHSPSAPICLLSVTTLRWPISKDPLMMQPAKVIIFFFLTITSLWHISNLGYSLTFFIHFHRLFGLFAYFSYQGLCWMQDSPDWSNRIARNLQAGRNLLLSLLNLILDS